jgi:hypothetical protein
MSDEEAPPPPADSVPPESPTADRGRERRRRLEGVIPEIVRRAVELGVEKAAEAPDNLKSFVGDLKLPKEIAHYLFTQVDETKNGLFRVVAKEIRDFLEHTNFGGEMQKILTTVQFEVNTTIRFTPNDGADRKRKDERAERGERGEEDEAEETAEASAESEGGERRTPVPLPRPEVKTNVHIRRERDERRRRRDR